MDENQQTSGDILRQAIQLLVAWGWVQHTDRSPDGFDLVGALEEVTGADLRDLGPEIDAVQSAFLTGAIDSALRALSAEVPVDSEDGDLPGARWAWVHRITSFNDAPTTTERQVVAALRRAASREIQERSLALGGEDGSRVEVGDDRRS